MRALLFSTALYLVPTLALAQATQPPALRSGGKGNIDDMTVVGRPTKERARDVINVLDAPYSAKCDGSFDDTTALQAAFDAAAARKGSIVQLPPRPCVITSGLTWRTGVTVLGSGYNAQWEPGAPVELAGSVLLVKGTGPKTQVAYGITDERTSGGRLDNAGSAAFPPTDSTIALTSYYNEDANPTTGAAATPAPFSAAVRLPPGTTGVNARDVRIVLNFNGVDGYNNGTLSLADNWDVGLYVDNASNNYFQNVQVVGYWRKDGLLMRCSLLPAELPVGAIAGCENNIFNASTFTGHKSVGVRAAGLWRVTGSGADWIEVPWAANHPFDPATNPRVIVGQFSPVTYTFGGLAVVGDKLRLTGVTPNPSSLGSTGDLYQQQFSNGIAKTTFLNSVMRGMAHFSKRRISDPAIAGALPPSAALEVSGMRLRGLQVAYSKLQTYDDVLVHLHQTIDTSFLDVQSEESPPVTGAAGGRWIATPGNTTRVPNPTSSNTLRTTVRLLQAGGDFSPEGGVRSAKFATDGFWLPNISSTMRARFGVLVGTDEQINKLEAFEKNGYTQTVVPASLGDLSLTAVNRSGNYQILDRTVMISSSYAATATYTTASGELRFNLPFVAQTKAGYFATLSVVASGVTFPSGYSQIVGQIASGQQYATLMLTGSAGTRPVTMADIPSGTAFRLSVTGWYVKP